MKNVVINHKGRDGFTTKFVGSFKGACEFIDGYNHEPSSKRIRNWSFNDPRDMQINPAGFGSSRLVVSECEQSTIEDYKLHLKELFAKKDAEREQRRKDYEDKGREELTKECRGWYIVELELMLPHRDITLGGMERRSTNWRILADSESEAFEQAVDAANEKYPVVYEVLSNPIDADISYVGMWTDELEAEFPTEH